VTLGEHAQYVLGRLDGEFARLTQEHSDDDSLFL